jgi:hypothetical protein
VIAHDAENDSQAQTGANPRRLGCEKWVKDTSLNGLRDTRAIIADFQQHAFFGNAFGLNAYGAPFALFVDGVPGIRYQVHEHLLKLPGVALDEREHRVKIKLHTNVFGCSVEALKFKGAGNNLIEGDSAALRPGVPGREQELAQDRAGTLRFLEYLACFVGIAGRIAAQKKTLRVTEDACKRVAEFVSNAGDHLAELGELPGLQQLGLENALGGEIFVDLDTSE